VFRGRWDESGFVSWGVGWLIGWLVVCMGFVGWFFYGWVVSCSIGLILMVVVEVVYTIPTMKKRKKEKKSQIKMYLLMQQRLGLRTPDGGGLCILFLSDTCIYIQ